jgi:sulfide:quinone oxidoreductase
VSPRNTNRLKEGKCVHLANIAFKKYFIHKMKSGATEPMYERFILKTLGITKLKQATY